jgi:hypothetical protein
MRRERPVTRSTSRTSIDRLHLRLYHTDIFTDIIRPKGVLNMQREGCRQRLSHCKVAKSQSSSIEIYICILAKISTYVHNLKLRTLEVLRDKARNRYMYMIHLLKLLRFIRMVDSTDRQPSI